MPQTPTKFVKIATPTQVKLARLTKAGARMPRILMAPTITAVSQDPNLYPAIKLLSRSSSDNTILSEPRVKSIARQIDFNSGGL